MTSTQNSTDFDDTYDDLLEGLDPSLADGFKISYEREIPLEIRACLDSKSSSAAFNDANSRPNVESIKVKLLVLGSNDSPTVVRLELSSEADLFFHYMHIIDESAFREIQHSQKLMVDFADYPNVLIRMLNACVREPHIHLGLFSLLSENEASLNFIQNMEYKFVELMSCNCTQSPAEVIQNQITYRYNSMKQKVSILNTRLHEINSLVKTKNPSLLLQLQKTNNGSASSEKRR